MGFEQRWARSLLAAFAPPDRPGLAPEPDEVDYAGALARMRRNATPVASLGLRLALWLVALAPLWLWGRLSSVVSLDVQRRTQLLGELLGHRSFFVREMTMLLKFTAAMALLGTQTVRERSGYDVEIGEQLAELDSGIRRRLPMLRGEAPRVAEGEAPHTPSGAAKDREREAG